MTDHVTQHQDWVKQYLKGSLSFAQTAEFEEFILDKPELIEQLELESILVSQLPKSSIGSGKRTLSPSLKRWIPDFWKLGLAAAFGAILVLPFINYPALQDPMTPQIQGLNQISYLETNRSISADSKVIELSRDTRQLILMIQPATLDETHFDVSLNNTDKPAENPLSASSQLANSGDLIVTLPAPLLSAGKYQLILTAANSKLEQTFNFELSFTEP